MSLTHGAVTSWKYKYSIYALFAFPRVTTGYVCIIQNHDYSHHSFNAHVVDLSIIVCDNPY